MKELETSFQAVDGWKVTLKVVGRGNLKRLVAVDSRGRKWLLTTFSKPDDDDFLDELRTRNARRRR